MRTKKQSQKSINKKAKLSVSNRRSNEEYKSQERSTDKLRKQNYRKDANYRIEEKSQDKANKQQYRENVDFTVKERELNKGYKVKERENEEFRDKEKETDKIHKRQIRENEEFKEREIELNKSYKQKERSDLEFKEREREFNKGYKEKERENADFRDKERQSGNMYRAQVRDHEFLKAREYTYNNLKRSTSNNNKMELEFIQNRSNAPTFVCFCCECLFFEHSVKMYYKATLEKTVDKNFLEKIYNTESNYVCITCKKYIDRHQIPKLATSNQLKFPAIPECIKRLNSVGILMITPVIPFMQIRELKSHVLNPQLGIKGSVVYVPAEMDKTVQVLPRAFNEMNVIQVKFKRHEDHKSDYKFETVQPWAVCEALKFMLDTPLYKLYKIEVDPEFFQRYESSTESIPFIVDNNDNDTSSQIDRRCLELLESVNVDELDFGEEVLLTNLNVNVNTESNNNQNDNNDPNTVKILAPAQNNVPVSSHVMEHLDELSRPDIFVGHAFNKTLPYSLRAKSECKRSDRRSCRPDRVLQLAKNKLEKSVIATVNICLRKTKLNSTLTAGDVSNKNFANHMSVDQGYRCLQHITGSPAYWELKKKEILAMIRQLGKPSIFLTLSAGEQIWPELLQALSKINSNINLTLQEAYDLDKFNKTKLIQSDPVTCARYFDYKMFKFMSMMKKSDVVFTDYNIVDTYSRVEFQMRGSPHEHIFIWLDKAPQYEKDNPEILAACIEFIDAFITCEYDETNPYIALQRHKHTHTCYKNQKIKKCRFHYPLPVMPRTMILEPLPKDEITDTIKNSLKEIQNYMEYLYKKQTHMTFEDILEKLSLDEASYITAIRSSLHGAQVFLRRNSLEVGINCYNKKIIRLFEANMDIQFILDAFAAVSYVVNYVAKIESGMSKLLRDAASEADNENKSIKDKFRKIANKFINANLMSAQESAYYILSLPISKMSRKCIYINTNPIKERVLMLKCNKDLEKLHKESNDIYMKDVQTKYTNRPQSMEDVCLADFVANHTYKATTEDYDDSHGDDYRERKRSAIIRYRRYKLIQDAANYYREQIMLFLPWRNEMSEVENVNHEEKYMHNLSVINVNRSKYSILGDEDLDRMLENVREIESSPEETEAETVPFANVDILEQAGIVAPKKDNNNISRFTCPTRVNENEINRLMLMLNVQQRKFVMHVLNEIKLNVRPVRIFLSGSAGVGKSLVINTLYQLITNYYDSLLDGNNDAIRVLLCAPSGKAAFLIKGVTLHTAFALPVSQFGGTMPQLSNDMANKIREHLFFTKLVMIDEISMVGSTLANNVNIRLQQIMGNNESFGGRHLIVVGDLRQLPPVMDRPIYKIPIDNELQNLFETNPLWDEFEYFELNEIMRQKGDELFINALNNLGKSQLDDNNIQLFKSRETDESNVPIEAIRLYAENKDVDEFNKMKINATPGDLHTSIAKDAVLGKVPDLRRQYILDSLKGKKITEVNGLPTVLSLKVNIKYMITSNVDVEDGLVNGSCGILKQISFSANSTDPYILWIDFQNDDVGRKAKLQYSNIIANSSIPKDLTPIKKISHTLNISNKYNFPVVRQQFPLVPAEAITVHKSQGQTYNSICVDFTKFRRITRSLLYVALSRVKSLNGLYILGTFRFPKNNSSADPVEKEITRLETNKLIKTRHDEFFNENGLKIIYQNVCSLRTKLENIKCDVWYTIGDIIIISETLLKHEDVVEFDGYETFFRSDSTKDTHGIICFKKARINVSNVQHICKIENKSHIELLKFEVNDLIIITGYKSPKVQRKLFEECFEKLFYEERNSIVNNIIVLGDFNYNNILNDSTNYIGQYLQKFGLNSKLPFELSTTNLNTQIDIIFSNIDYLVADVYETYFSYHKPIYATVRDSKLPYVIDQNVKSISHEPVNSINKSIDNKRKRTDDMEHNDEDKEFKILKKTVPLFVPINNINNETKIIINECKNMLEEIRDNNLYSSDLTALGNYLQEHERFFDKILQILRTKEPITKPNINSSIGVIDAVPNNIRAHLSRHETTGDGNCFYYACSYDMFETEEYMPLIRLAGFKCMMQYADYFESFAMESESKHLVDLLLSIGTISFDEDKVRSKYTQLHAPSTFSWACSVHLLAVSIALNRPIIVYFIKEDYNSIAEPRRNLNNGPIHVQLFRNHFEALIPDTIITSYIPRYKTGILGNPYVISENDF